MPEMPVVTPAAAMPADRLILGATDARAGDATTTSPGGILMHACTTHCMAEA